jgi:hypothetical protein
MAVAEMQNGNRAGARAVLKLLQCAVKGGKTGRRRGRRAATLRNAGAER